MSARSSKQTPRARKVAESATEKIPALQTKTSVLPKHPRCLGEGNQNCGEERIPPKDPTAATSRLNQQPERLSVKNVKSLRLVQTCAARAYAAASG